MQGNSNKSDAHPMANNKMALRGEESVSEDDVVSGGEEGNRPLSLQNMPLEQQEVERNQNLPAQTQQLPANTIGMGDVGPLDVVCGRGFQPDSKKQNT